MRKIVDEYRCHFKVNEGYTFEEAKEKAAKINEAYGVARVDSKWNPAEIIVDPDFKTGYKLTIEAK